MYLSAILERTTTTPRWTLPHGFSTSRPESKLVNFAEIGVLPWGCSFFLYGQETWCEFNQDQSDQADAVLHRGPTDTEGTGPLEEGGKG